MNLPVGTLLQGGKYMITRFIGSGGFGCTYEAEHIELDEKVAIKEFFVKDFCNRDETTLRISVATQGKVGLVDKLRSKFKDEARSLYRLRHPGIVHVSDVFEENGTAYYVMDYVDGRSLQDIVASEGPLPEGRALKYVRQVAGALAYVHSNNRLHLDIKPGNVMVDKSDNAILIDFGASKQYDEENGENTSTLVGKTPGYAPLEQMSNRVTNFFPATDIYALGATLYKLLTAVTPPDAAMLASGGEELAPLPSAVSANIRRAISATMSLKKDDRPQSIDGFLAIIDGAEASKSLAEQARPSEDPRPADDSTVLDEKEKHGGSGRGFINGHEWVDLGLSVKWATCNVGASSPSDYGDYYAWGEISTKSKYEETNSSAYRVSMGDISGDSRYDTARANRGGTWRLPTRAEIQELIDNCTWQWTTQDGHKGCKVTGPNGSSIFLPAAGLRGGSSLCYVGDYGDYWSSTPNMGDARNACHLSFNNRSFHDWYWDSRYYGRSIRPVSDQGQGCFS